MPLAVVTGSSGFIGRHLVRRLVADGADVVAIDRRPAPERHPAVVPLVADLAETDPTVDAALRRADVVFHLAGRPGVRDRAPDVERGRQRDNVLAGARVLAVVPDRVPVVVASSSSVYGGAVPAGGGVRASREDDPLLPRGGYARSKVALEERCRRRAEAGGAVSVARPFTVAGEGQRPDMAIATWLDAARTRRPMRLLGGPDRTRDITDVADVVEGLVRLAAVPGVTVNLGTGRAQRLGDVIAAIASLAGPVEVAVESAGPGEPAHTLADVGRCVALLGFVPTTDLEALIDRQLRAADAAAGVAALPAMERL